MTDTKSSFKHRKQDGVINSINRSTVTQIFYKFFSKQSIAEVKLTYDWCRPNTLDIILTLNSPEQQP